MSAVVLCMHVCVPMCEMDTALHEKCRSEQCVHCSLLTEVMDILFCFSKQPYVLYVVSLPGPTVQA